MILTVKNFKSLLFFFFISKNSIDKTINKFLYFVNNFFRLLNLTMKAMKNIRFFKLNLFLMNKSFFPAKT